MKPFFTYSFLLFAFITNAQTFNLNYKPKGQVVRICFDSLLIYTDTTSLFSVYENEEALNDYGLSVRNHVRRKISEAQSDTVTIYDSFIPFNDSKKINQKQWDAEWAILH